MASLTSAVNGAALIREAWLSSRPALLTQRSAIARQPGLQPVDDDLEPEQVLGVERWPDAFVVGIDSSAEMIERARRDHPELTWRVGDVTAWEPEEPIDVAYSNAALHWLDDHADLFRRLRSLLADGGVLAVQMPDNWAAPTHRIPAEVLDEGDWPDAARSALMRDRLSDPASYARWAQPAEVDLWRTTYHHQLTGEDPVWTWGTGSLLRPVLATLEGSDR